MSKFDYDLFVIGAGSGGVRASRIAATHGAKVAVAEDLKMGGTCVNVGCVPKKLFVYGSHFKHDVEDAAGFGWDTQSPILTWQRLIQNKNVEIERLNGIYDRILMNAGVEIIRGRASLVDKNTVAVGDKQYTADKILIAVGGWPYIPESLEGREHVISSNEAFYLQDLPKRVVVVGGGYIAVEFSCIFNGYGSEVTQLYRGPLFLRGFDKDVREHLAEEMKKAGVNLQFNSNPKKISKNDDGSLTVTLEDDSKLECDVIMYATGRVAKTKNLGLEAAGVTMTKKGDIVVDEYSRTNIPNIFAVGDVTNRINLTPVALAEGHCFADTEFGGKDRRPNHENVATAVFSQPPIGTVGLTEEQARENHEVEIYKSSFRPMKHTLSGRNERALMKMIVDKQSRKVLGVHVCCPDAGEIIQGIGIAIKAGATKEVFDSTIGVHPTSAEELVTMRTPVAE